MSKICPGCGAQCQDAELFCSNCGSRLPAEPHYAPQQPNPGGRPAPRPAKPVSSLATVKNAKLYYKILAFGLLIAVATYNLVMGIMTLSGEVCVSVMSQRITLNYIHESGEFGALNAFDMIYGLVLLGLSAVAVLTHINLLHNKQDTPKFLSILTLTSLAAIVLYLMFFLILGSQDGIRVWPHFSVWIVLVFDAVWAAANWLLMPLLKSEFNR